MKRLAWVSPVVLGLVSACLQDFDEFVVVEGQQVSDSTAEAGAGSTRIEDAGSESPPEQEAGDECGSLGAACDATRFSCELTCEQARTACRDECSGGQCNSQCNKEASQCLDSCRADCLLCKVDCAGDCP